MEAYNTNSMYFFEYDIDRWYVNCSYKKKEEEEC